MMKKRRPMRIKPFILAAALAVQAVAAFAQV